MSGKENSFQLQPDNWFFLLHRSTRPSASALDLSGAGSLDQLLRVTRVEVQFVLDQLLDLARNSDEAWEALPPLLEELRQHLLARKGAAERGRRRPLLHLPGIDSPVLAEDRLLASLCSGLPWLANHACLRSWSKQIPRSKKLVERGRSSGLLRSLLEIAASQGARSLLPSLRKIHSRDLTPEAVREQTELAEKFGFYDVLCSAQDWLGLKRRRRRRRPFLIKKTRSGPTAKNAKLEVLLIDSGKPRNRELSLSSIEAQSLQPASVKTLPESGELAPNLLEACRESKSEWLSLIRSGDSYHPRRLTECMALVGRSKNSSLICSAVHLVDAKGLQVTANSCNRLEHGDLVFDWVQLHDKQRPKTAQPGKLLHTLHTADFVLSPSNLICRRDFLAEELAGLIASPQTIAWQLAFIAAQKAGLVYRNKKLLAIPIPKAKDLFTPGSGSDLGISTSLDGHLQRRLLLNLHMGTPTQAYEEKDPGGESAAATVAAMQSKLANSLAERDRLASELRLIRSNRDRLETLLTARQTAPSKASTAPPTQVHQIEGGPSRPMPARRSQRPNFGSPSITPRVSNARMVCTLPPDSEAMDLMRELTGLFGRRPEILYWQDENCRYHSGRMLRTDRDAFIENLSFLRRSHPAQLDKALGLFAEALSLSLGEVEFNPDLQGAFTFSRKVSILEPVYLQSWGFERAATACLLSQLLFATRRGMVLTDLPELGTVQARLLPLHLASAYLLMVDRSDLRRQLVEMGVEAERVFLLPGELPAIREQLAHLLIGPELPEKVSR
ncbi:MAG: hypothetical protein ACYTG5_10115 [Planctomycetota bacterium]|jgi:hypothetical protein